MQYYHKIDTLFERGDNFGVIRGYYRRPEFNLINYWSVTEKVDGTSTIITYSRPSIDGILYVIGGRTAKTDTLQTAPVLNEIGENSFSAVVDVMNEYELDELTIYGETYGPKIQGKFGIAYADQIEFRAFDIKAGNKFLSPTQFEQVADQLGIKTVPNLGIMSTSEIVEFVKEGFNSTFSARPVAAEGIIAKSPVELTNNAGKRLMFKLKTADFK